MKADVIASISDDDVDGNLAPITAIVPLATMHCDIFSFEVVAFGQGSRASDEVKNTDKY